MIVDCHAHLVDFLTEDERAAILGDNADKLYSRFSA